MLNLRVEKKRDKSRKIRNQACLYVDVGCMYSCWLFGSVTRFMQFAGKTPPDTVTVFFAVIPVPPNITRFETGTRFTAPFAESRIHSSIHGISQLV